MWRRLSEILLLALVCAAFVAAEEQKSEKGELKVPPEVAKQANPVKPTAALLAAAKKTYNIDCAMCHGKDGDGKGDLAADMKLELANYQDPEALKNKTDGELFYMIQKGFGDMPPEGDRAKPDDIWSLVNYVRSFAKKSAAPKAEKS